MMPMRYSHFHKTSGATPGTGSDTIMATLMVTAATCDQKQQIQRHVPPLKEGNFRASVPTSQNFTVGPPSK